MLRAVAIATPHIVWYADGTPFALDDPAQPGEHRFQIGLPLRPERSRPVRVIVK
ncbi:MAG TPA: hypothetical protein VFN46_05680 [Acetobacteraceae bacterium]|nr:hypothetical protein [Acetobacteraceae bacterium]